jgi:hypothetical protein
MKELIGVLVLATSFTCLAQVSIGTPTPHPSAALEINSTTKGFLLPRMTELQMISIDNAIEGLMVYCSDCSKKGIYLFNGSEFTEITIDNSESILTELEDLINIANFPAFGGTPSLEDLADFGIVGATESQISYEEAIAQALPEPETIEDLQIIINAVNALIPPTITSEEIAQTITENIGEHQEVYTVTATDLTGVGSYGIGGLDSSSFSIDPNTGAVYLLTNPDFETQAVYTFSVTATDVDGNTCLPFPVSLSVNDADDFERKWGLVRYIMIRGTDENGIYSNVGELDILDPDGNNLIDNGTLILDDFTYRYGGGYYSGSSGAYLFDNNASDSYANNAFSVDEGQKWVLIDLNQTVEIGALTIQARSNSSSHMERIKHITVFASDRADSGFTYSGTENTNNNEDLTLNTSSYLMKTDTTLWWCSLEEFNENNNPITFVKARQLIDTIKPIITSDSVATPIIENSGAGQVVYSISTFEEGEIVAYNIGGTDANFFSIDTISGVITLVENPNTANKNFYSFYVSAKDNAGNTSTPKQVSLIILEETTWGQTRYIMFRGTDENGLYNNIGELDILDSLGINLIDNGVLDKNNFTYRYGGGYYSNSPGLDLFNNSSSNNYANNSFSVNEGQKWVLIDLNQTVEIGALRIQARSNSSSHIDRITHLTVFTSNRNDTGFSYSGVENTNNKNENLILEKNLDQMKSDPTLKWQNLKAFSSTNISIDFDKGISTPQNLY